jgi:hypothetical protein
MAYNTAQPQQRFGRLACLADKCLFFNDTLKEKHVLVVWVDDFVFIHETEATFAHFIALLRKGFTIPATAPFSAFLGMEVSRSLNEKKMVIVQTSSINVLLERAKMMDCNPTNTPCPPGTVFSKHDSPVDAASNATTTEYRGLIALANFISCWTRPDITFTVNKLCKFMSNPGEKHWSVLKHLLRYLAGTRATGLIFDFSDSTAPGPNPKLLGYTDSSFADCPDSGRSTLAYVFYYGHAVLSWYSKLNTYVTTCTNHSEYTALALGCKEAEWLVLLFSELDHSVKHTPLPIYVDNSGIVSMVFNPVDHQSNKHVKIGCHYTRELADNKIIIPIRIPTVSNIADIFTKPLAAPNFKLLAPQLVSNSLPTTAHSFMFDCWFRQTGFRQRCR